MINRISSFGHDKSYGVYDFVVDNVEEIKQLPANCGMGSTVLVINEKSVYIKNGAGRWVAI